MSRAAKTPEKRLVAICKCPEKKGFVEFRRRVVIGRASLRVGA